MARELVPQGFSFVFVYTREAHPSDRYPGHDSFSRKLEHARSMARELGFERPMLVDDLEGTTHHAFGRLPNMTYILNAAGQVTYRASWTDPRTIRIAVEQLMFQRDERRARRRMTPYYAEWQPQRLNDDIRFVQDLYALGGDRPVEDYVSAMESLEGPTATKAIRAWWNAKQSDGTDERR